ncbi:DUF2848 domain-containing protein [Amycolatopsis sp. WAC 01376]|uniref:DUF2848 domain-containing protein n=1 Tax=Amycolatopsis sp. WAC 01376 TaxID=2203195 RepID=UPI000F790235|nr:DUF2848 domain-containing protein [Amycolatopsis sp. WAC 01376]RSM66856.1 DUF2848 domain-containing protein [Amycolatopsis sp. WAC 01376]
MPELRFTLPGGEERRTEVHTLLNAGYAGRSQEDVAAHVAELAELGVPAPSVIPALYPVAPYLASQTDEVPVQHERTSGEAEWALVITGPEPEDVLLTAACDHTDRALEAHGVAWSKNAGPDVLAAKAWRLVDVQDRLDDLTLSAWAGETLIQQGKLAELLPPSYWLDVLRERGLHAPGTVLISGTIPMVHGVDQFADSWRVELGDPATGETIELAYTVRRLPEPIG